MLSWFGVQSAGCVEGVPRFLGLHRLESRGTMTSPSTLKSVSWFARQSPDDTLDGWLRERLWVLWLNQGLGVWRCSLPGTCPHHIQSGQCLPFEGHCPVLPCSVLLGCLIPSSPDPCNRTLESPRPHRPGCARLLCTAGVQPSLSRAIEAAFPWRCWVEGPTGCHQDSDPGDSGSPSGSPLVAVFPYSEPACPSYPSPGFSVRSSQKGQSSSYSQH